MTDDHTPLVDFHSHYYDPAWYPEPVALAGKGVARAWPLLTDIAAQLDVLAVAGIDAKVLTAPASSIVPPGKRIAPDLTRRINDRFAALVAQYPGKLHALATIDPFAGDDAARETERAVRELGLGGIVVDCASGDRFLDDPAARPTLDAAAALGVPVFVHPVSPAGITERLSRFGHIGTLLARGTEDAVSILALLRAGILDALPDLTLVIPSIGAASLLFAGIADEERGREDGWHGTPPPISRKRLYVDTMGFDPAFVRFAVQLLGADHVLFGSDWPIMSIGTPDRVRHTLALAGVTGDDEAAILSGNALRLLKGRRFPHDIR